MNILWSFLIWFRKSAWSVIPPSKTAAVYENNKKKMKPFSEGVHFRFKTDRRIEPSDVEGYRICSDKILKTSARKQH